MAVTTEQQKAIDYLVSKHKVPLYAATGIVAGLSGESGTQLNTKAINKGDGKDGSDSVGIAQWNSQRVVDGTRFLGKPLREATGYEQLDFLMHELNTTESKAKSIMKQADNAADVTMAFVNHFERPKDPNAGNVRVERYLNPLLGVKATEGYKAPDRTEPNAYSKFQAEKEAQAEQDRISAKITKETDEAVEKDKMDKYLASSSLPTDTDNMFKNGFNSVFNAGNEALTKLDVMVPENTVTKYVVDPIVGMGAGLEKVAANIIGGLQKANDYVMPEPIKQVQTGLGLTYFADKAKTALENRVAAVDSAFGSKDTFNTYDAGKFVGEVAPAIAVPVVRAAELPALTTMAANSALQGGSAYLMADDNNRGTAAAIGGSLPIIGKGIAELSRLTPEQQTGRVLANRVDAPLDVSRPVLAQAPRLAPMRDRVLQDTPIATSVKFDTNAINALAKDIPNVSPTVSEAALKARVNKQVSSLLNDIGDQSLLSKYAATTDNLLDRQSLSELVTDSRSAIYNKSANTIKKAQDDVNRYTVDAALTNKSAERAYFQGQLDNAKQALADAPTIARNAAKSELSALKQASNTIKDMHIKEALKEPNKEIMLGKLKLTSKGRADKVASIKQFEKELEDTILANKNLLKHGSVKDKLSTMDHILFTGSSATSTGVQILGDMAAMPLSGIPIVTAVSMPRHWLREMVIKKLKTTIDDPKEVNRLVDEWTRTRLGSGVPSAAISNSMNVGEPKDDTFQNGNSPNVLLEGIKQYGIPAASYIAKKGIERQVGNYILGL